MIFDDFKNIDLYKIDSYIKDFILNIDPSIKAGRYVISDNAYMNIDEYKTRKKETIKLEAHRKYIDIQFLIKGKERVYTTNKEGLSVLKEYDENLDIEFYRIPERKLNISYLTKNKFMVLYPNDVHAPCINYENESEDVKKAIVKIRIN